MSNSNPNTDNLIKLKPEQSSKWAGILYPESLHDDWLQLLEDSGVPAIISPLHDKDLNSDGTIKKMHYHVYLYFGRVKKTKEEVKSILDALCKTHAPNPQRAYAPEGLYKYFTHAENTDKAQYKAEDIIYLNGASTDILERMPHKQEKALAIKAITQLIDENNISNFTTLISYIRDYHFELFEVACSNHHMLHMYIKYMSKHKEQDIANYHHEVQAKCESEYPELKELTHKAKSYYQDKSHVRQLEDLRITDPVEYEHKIKLRNIATS